MQGKPPGVAEGLLPLLLAGDMLNLAGKPAGVDEGLLPLLLAGDLLHLPGKPAGVASPSQVCHRSFSPFSPGGRGGKNQTTARRNRHTWLDGQCWNSSSAHSVWARAMRM